MLNLVKERELLLHLSLIDNVGPATIEKLVQAFLNNNFSFLNLYNLNSQDLMHYAKLSQRISETIVKSLSDKKILDNEQNLLQKNKINYITILDTNYPNLLKSINLPPTIIYVYGHSLQTDDRIISMVGSRQADNYGYSVVNKIVPELVKHNCTLVSGGALGIDTAVHKATLDSQGKTIAVLGSGLLRPYPALNKNLFEKIAQTGSVISPFSLTTSALPGNFPARNRIIAGLSKACIVIQAAESSGALITAQFALNEAREVCAIPGSIENALSVGCHKLISQGAHLVTSADEIRFILHDFQTETKTKQIFYKPQTIEEKILVYCSTPISFDELLIKSQIDQHELQEKLWDLQLDGIISQNFIGYWYKT